MNFKPALNEATLLNIDLCDFISSSKEAGFDAIELRTEKIREWLEQNSNNTLEVLDAYLKKENVKLISINALEDFNLCTDEVFEQQVKVTLDEMIKYCVSLGCDLIVTVPSFFSMEEDTPNEESLLKITTKRLEIIADIAKKSNIRIGFETLGFSDCSIRTINEAVHIFEQINPKIDNIGIIIDTCHFFVAYNPLSSIDLIKDLYLIHVNDLECDFETHDLTWVKDSDRVMPGNGNFQYKEFFKKIKELHNYNGYVSLELFNEDYWQQNPKKVAKLAMDSLKSIGIL